MKPAELIGIAGIAALALAAFHFSKSPTSPANPTPAPVAPIPGPLVPGPQPAPAPAVRGVLLFFTTANCSPCKRLKASLESPTVREEAARWDVRTVENDSAALERWKVTTYPTLVAVREGYETGRLIGYRSPDELLQWLVGYRVQWQQLQAKVGGNTAPDGTEAHCDMPGELMQANIASKGLGCCVFRSIDHAARWQNVPAFLNFPEWMVKKGIAGGGYPSKVEELIPQIAKDRGLPVPEYLQVEGSDLEILKAACRSGRMPGVTYCVSAAGRYGGQRISHMVNIVHADDRWFAVLDNNFVPKDGKTVNCIEWLTPEEFKKTYCPGGKGWAVILLDPAPPPPPRNAS